MPVPIQHVNRRGDTYYLHQGKTKTGKPKWFFSKKQEANVAESIPKGFEIYENANAQVFLRKIMPKLITDEEVAMVEDGIRKLAKLQHFFVEVKKDSIIVHLPNQGAALLDGSIFSGFVRPDHETLSQIINKCLTFSPMMKFTLVDEEQRYFFVERWCFLGSIDDWFPLSGGDLSKMVRKYVPHLGKESFYELM